MRAETLGTRRRPPLYHGCARFITNFRQKMDQLILMDVQMPVMNGYEAAKAIRALDHPLAKAIPLIPKQ